MYSVHFCMFSDIILYIFACYQVFCTFILVGASLAITDPRNMLPSNGFLPVALGSVVFAIGTSFVLNSGYAINPARDLSPRIFIAMAGWGTEPFT